MISLLAGPSRRAVVAALAPLALLAACGSDPAPTSPSNGVVSSVLTPQDLVARRGQYTRLQLFNNGTIPLRYKECIVAVERQSTTGWKRLDLPAEWRDCKDAGRTLAPHTSATAVQLMPTSLDPGVYQVALFITRGDAADDALPMLRFSSTFELR
jgi:hypothetical protein